MGTVAQGQGAVTAGLTFEQVATTCRSWLEIQRQIEDVRGIAFPRYEPTVTDQESMERVVQQEFHKHRAREWYSELLFEADRFADAIIAALRGFGVMSLAISGAKLWVNHMGELEASYSK